ncbi:MAG: pitrilysin family protein [Gemmatimonadota bacterium]
MMTTTTPASWTASVHRRVLPNGLTLLAQRDRSAAAVAVVTHVKAGFFDEPDRWQGISHVLEHMFFKGTPTRGVGSIARETKGAGGYLNASTSYDRTSYFVVLPSQNLETALDIQADALRNSTVDADELARELQVIIQEARRKLDSPGAVAYETLHEVMYDVHRVRRWRIGFEAQLAGFTRDDLIGYYRSRYVPERTIIAIVGDVDECEALDAAERKYGDWGPAEGAVDRSPEEPARTGVRTRTLRGDVAQAEVVLGWRTVPPLHPDSTALELAAAVLGNGRGSWLYRRLRETGVATSVSAYNYAPTELGTFTVGAEVEPERVNDALVGVAEAITTLRARGPGAADLARARTLLRAQWSRRMEQMEGRASALAMAEALGGIEILDREYDEIETTTVAQVQSAAARWLAPESVSAVVYLPEGRGSDLDVAAVEHAFAMRRELTLTAPAPLPHTAAAPIPALRLQHHRGADVYHLALPGADVLVRRKPGVPLVTIGVYAPRADQDPPGKAGLATLATRAAVRGAGHLDAAALAFAFERLGGSLGSVPAPDWAGFTATVLADRLQDAAGLLHTVFTAPSLSDATIDTERRLLISEAEQAADDMFRYPFQLAYRAAFGEQGYGLPVAGLPETLAAITAADVRAWHRDALLGARPLVVAVGDVEPARAAEALGAIYAALPAHPMAPKAGTLGWAVHPGQYAARIVSRDKAQTALAMAFPGPARRDPARYAAEVWAAVASGLGGRLFDALRERRSLAYTVLAAAWHKGRAGALVTYIATGPEREDEARDAMLEELAVFRTTLVSDVELAQAIAYLAGQSEVHRQAGSAVAFEILDAWLIGEGLDELVDPAAGYRGVTADAVRAVAQRMLDPDIRAEGVIRGSRTAVAR